MGDTINIFICYATEDYERVAPVYDLLEKKGYTPWMDERNLLAGKKIEYTIKDAIEKSHFFLAFLSQTSITKRSYLQKELRIALDKNNKMLDEDIYIIPVRLDECEIPKHFADYNVVNLFAERGLDKLFQAIEYEVKKRITT